MSAKPAITQDDLLNAIAGVLAFGDEIPERETGWLDMMEMMTAYGMSENRLRRLLNLAVERGELETKIVIDSVKRCRVRVWRRREGD